MDLAGKIVVVTGASRGLGDGMAESVVHDVGMFRRFYEDQAMNAPG
jgi:NAD(P)-dependent dehydrogenase (short-subunit alcohol dehydrogenase family)